jgi:hypothetical protein
VRGTIGDSECVEIPPHPRPSPRKRGEGEVPRDEVAGVSFYPSHLWGRDEQSSLLGWREAPGGGSSRRYESTPTRHIARAASDVPPSPQVGGKRKAAIFARSERDEAIQLSCLVCRLDGLLRLRSQ